MAHSTYLVVIPEATPAAAPDWRRTYGTPPRELEQAVHAILSLPASDPWDSYQIEDPGNALPPHGRAHVRDLDYDRLAGLGVGLPIHGIYGTSDLRAALAPFTDGYDVVVVDTHH